MKKISTLEELKYRKLYLRSEIRLKEDAIKRQLESLKEQLNSPLVKSRIFNGLISNPSLVINAARLIYDLVKRWKKRRKERKSK